MYEIVLLCQYGASTGMLTTKMKEEAEKQGISAEIHAYSESELDSIMAGKKVGVVLLGPQIRYKKKDFEKKYASTGIEFLVIDPADYGMMNGEKILKLALEHCRKEEN